MTNLSSPRRPAGFARQFGLAVALATGTAMLAVPGFTGTAHAEKKKKEEKEAPKAAYSPEFVKAYQPVEAALKAPGVDVAALKPQLLALAALSVSPDEKNAGGAMLYNGGLIGKDPPLQLQGADLMLASGKLPEQEAGRFNLVASQICVELKQFEKARAYLQKAIDLNYSAQGITTADLQVNIADTYFAEERLEEGLNALKANIDARKAAGLPVDQRIYVRGVNVAYKNELPQVYEFSRGWVSDYPTTDNWRDAINITRNLNDFEGPVMLDLLRLGKQLGTLKEKDDYITYIETADTRRLPAEVQAVIKEANDKGVIPKGSDSWVEEQSKLANSLVAEDRSALPVLERDANAANAQLRTVLAAGDSFLSYGDYAKAVAFYQKALGLPGADRNLILSRLGIAQVGAGQATAASESLGQVQGPRAIVAGLWGAYAAQLGKAAAPAAPAAPAAGG